MTAAGRALTEWAEGHEQRVKEAVARIEADARAEVLEVLRDIFPGNDVDAVEDALREKGWAP